jgi:hypothetical protein
MELVEFQVKKGAAPEFKLKQSLFNEKQIKVFKDGERYICYVKDEKKLMDEVFYEVEDLEGTMTAVIGNKSFFKITEFKNHSKRFNLLKQQLKIKDQ